MRMNDSVWEEEIDGAIGGHRDGKQETEREREDRTTTREENVEEKKKRVYLKLPSPPPLARPGFLL